MNRNEQIWILSELFLMQLQISQRLAEALKSENTEFRWSVIRLYADNMNQMREKMVRGLDILMEDTTNG
jgi:hypothetical protein